MSFWSMWSNSTFWYWNFFKNYILILRDFWSSHWQEPSLLSWWGLVKQALLGSKFWGFFSLKKKKLKPPMFFGCSIRTFLFPDMCVEMVLQHCRAALGSFNSQISYALLHHIFCACCLYTHPSSFHYPLHSKLESFQQATNKTLDETLKLVPTTCLSSCWRLECLIGMKLYAGSYNYKLPLVTVEQISLATV